MNCYACGGEIPSGFVSRSDLCPSCRRDSRVCKNCNFYDTTFNNECREPQADRVVDKEKSNFCDYFIPSTKNKAGGGKSQKDILSAAEALFKKV